MVPLGEVCRYLQRFDKRTARRRVCLNVDFNKLAGLFVSAAMPAKPMNRAYCSSAGLVMGSLAWRQSRQTRCAPCMKSTNQVSRAAESKILQSRGREA